jgi:MipA family protein
MSHGATARGFFMETNRIFRWPTLLFQLLRHAGATCCAFGALLGHHAAVAQESSGTSPLLAVPERTSELGLGLAIGAIERPYLGIGSETIALPILIYENRWLSIAGPVVDLKLPIQSPLLFRLRARFEPGIGYNADDSSALVGMNERKAGIWVGGAALWQPGIIDVEAEWLADASGYTEGQRATLSLQRRFPAGRFSITPRVEAIWLDRKNVNYYYGVREQEAQGVRTYYEAEGAINTRLGVRVDYFAHRRHLLFVDLRTTFLANEITNSPIVDQPNSSSAFFGYVYQW